MQPKVLAVISFFYPFHGGAEHQALLLCRRLRQRGIPVSVLTRYFPKQQSGEMLQGVPVFRAIRTMPWGKLFGISYFLSCLYFMIKQRHTYDILHCYILQGFHSPAAVIMKYFFRKKVVIRVSATGPLSDFLLLQQGLMGGLMLRFIRKADRIITLCSQSTEEALGAGFSREQIVSIRNGVDTSVFSTPEQPLASSRSILFIGRLDHMKGVDVLLKAIAELNSRGLKTTCTVVGDGPLMEHLQETAQALGVAGQTVFAGACADPVDYLKKASFFVLPSRSEGVPNVILEAMACGLPIIATSVGGIPDIIQDGCNGLLIAPDDVPALSLALTKLLTDHDLVCRLGKQARMDAEEYFSIDKVADAYLSLYQIITTQKN